MKIQNEVLEVLSRSRVGTKQIELPEQLDRKLYAKVAKVIEAAGGAWNKRIKKHSFDGDGADAEKIIEDLLLTGEVHSAVDDYEFYETPPSVVERMIGISGIGRGMLVLEPSAGRGAIAVAATKTGARVECSEIDPKNVRVLLDLGYTIQGTADFLKAQERPVYDAVLMNPPFSKQQDVDHVLHAFEFLKPGGRLVAVMSAGVTFRSNRKSVEFREFVRANGGTIEPLPAESFKASGTSVNTVLVFVRKVLA